MLVGAYATETVVGLANSQCAAAFRFLAFGVLGVDRRRSSFRFSLRGGSFNATARSPRRQSLRTLDICVDANAAVQFCENRKLFTDGTTVKTEKRPWTLLDAFRLLPGETPTEKPPSQISCRWSRACSLGVPGTIDQRARCAVLMLE